jgi:molybdopterin converting factor small subunit
MPTVRVEFYGLARLRAGRAELLIEAATVGEALAAADAACPGLHTMRGGRLSLEYLVSVGGTRFTRDTRAPIPTGQPLLVLGADAGG